MRLTLYLPNFKKNRMGNNLEIMIATGNTLIQGCFLALSFLITENIYAVHTHHFTVVLRVKPATFNNSQRRDFLHFPKAI